jgi:hypothetical protein
VSGKRCLWLQGERIGEHVHVSVRMGRQYGQDDMPTYEKERGHANNVGDAGNLILHADEWGPFISALAVGGYENDLRVIWRCPPEEPRYLWNGAEGYPCIVGSTDAVDWNISSPTSDGVGETAKTEITQPKEPE